MEELETQTTGQESEREERLIEAKRRYKDEISQLKDEIDDQKNKIVSMKYEHQREIEELQAFQGTKSGGGASLLNSQLMTVEGKLQEREKLLKEMKTENDRLRQSLN